MRIIPSNHTPESYPKKHDSGIVWDCVGLTSLNGPDKCCLRWRWEGSLLCLRVGFSFLCGSAGGWAESLSCYFLTSFATSFGRRSARRGFKNRKPIGEVGCCESRMAERSHWWTESSKAKRVSNAKKVSGPKRQVFLNPRNMNGRIGRMQL